MRTRHTAAAGLAAAALLALTSCTTEAADTSSDSATASAKPATSAAADKAKPKPATEELAYLTTIRTKTPKLEDAADKQLVDLGKKSCAAITAGNTPTAVALQIEKNMQIGLENSGHLVGASVSSFCPEHKSKL